MSDTEGRSALVARAQPYVGAVLLVVGAIVAAFVLRGLPHANLSLLFVSAVLLVAAAWGLRPAIVAIVLSFLALDFLFTAPMLTLAVEGQGDVATLLFFLAIAALLGSLAARMRTQMARDRAALERASTLLEFGRRMTAVTTAEQVLEALIEHLSGSAHASVTARLFEPAARVAAGAASSEATDGRLVAETPAEPVAPGARRGAVTVAGRTHIPLVTSGGQVGTVVIDAEPDAPERELAEGLCEQASVAIERVALVDDQKAAQLVAETERLRSALLSSVSHDLATPLASIISSTTSMLERQDTLNLDQRGELLHRVLDESQRLNRYIQNLLDMTRLGQRGFRPNREWVDLNELIGAALERLNGVLEHVTVDVDVSPSVSSIYVHGALIEQALVNLLDNAADFAPDGDVLRVSAHLEQGATIIEVVDHGPGIIDSERERVFDTFYRAKQDDRHRQGVGLSLALCRSLIAAHNGTISAQPGADDHGTCMRIALPIDDNPVSDEHA